ncbi:MAPEG family protein [Ensifer soli]|uniref:MAPEG family protein n=1 Tax=Ciceribacter sp. sgz301302 TaxID=3342379 RepID=UPI0035B85A27
MASGTALFWPVIAQVALVFAIYILMAKRRFAAVRTGRVPAKAYLIPTVEPEPSATVARSLINQFELPVLFYVAVVVAHLTGAAGTPMVALCWLFVASRYAHAYVHVTSNRLMLRQRLFSLGVAALAAVWVLIAWTLAGV